MAANEEQDVMNELQGQWNEEMSTGATSAIKGGDAALRCINTFLNRSSNGRKQMNWQLEILTHANDPGSVGKKVIQRFGIETVEDIKRINTALVNLQLEPIRSPQDILRANREMMNVCFNGKLAENKDPQFPPNVYINAGARRKDLESDSGGSPAAAQAPRF